MFKVCVEMPPQTLTSSFLRKLAYLICLLAQTELSSSETDVSCGLNFLRKKILWAN